MYVRGECVVVCVRDLSKIIADYKCNNMTKCSSYLFLIPYNPPNHLHLKHFV